MFFSSLTLFSFPLVWVNTRSKSSGHHFFRHLSASLNAKGYKSSSILVNIDVSIFRLLLFKICRKRIVIRCDGIYLDYPTLSLCGSSSFISLLIFTVANFLPHHRIKILRYALNLPEFLKLYLSSFIVFQSKFSQDSVFTFFPHLSRKPHAIINNAIKIPENFVSRTLNHHSSIEILSLFDARRARKRTDLLLLAFDQLSYIDNINFNVKFVGFDKNITFPNWFDKRAIEILLNPPHWLELSGKYLDPLLDLPLLVNNAHVALTLTQYDPCPNHIIEMISNGLPLIAAESGGLNEIVGDAGLFFPDITSSKLDFCDDLCRDTAFWDNDTVQYMTAQIASRLSQLCANYELYCSRARDQASQRLSLEYALQKYFHLMDL